MIGKDVAISVRIRPATGAVSSGKGFLGLDTQANKNVWYIDQSEYLTHFFTTQDFEMHKRIKSFCVFIYYLRFEHQEVELNHLMNLFTI